MDKNQLFNSPIQTVFSEAIQLTLSVFNLDFIARFVLAGKSPKLINDDNDHNHGKAKPEENLVGFGGRFLRLFVVLCRFLLHFRDIWWFVIDLNFKNQNQ